MRRFWRSTALTLPVSAVLSVLPTPNASAAWTSSTSGTGKAAARVLAKPTSVTATCASLTSIRVRWAATEVSPQVEGYQVARSGDGGSSWTDRGGLLPASTATEYTYTDSGIGLGTYVYRVVAIKGNWRSTSQNSTPRTVTLLVCS